MNGSTSNINQETARLQKCLGRTKTFERIFVLVALGLSLTGQGGEVGRFPASYIPLALGLNGKKEERKKGRKK